MRQIFKERAKYLKKKREEDLENAKKEELKETLKSNKPIPYHLRNEAKTLLDKMIYNVTEDSVVYSSPKIAVTTSRNPSSMLLGVSKHLSLVFNGQHMMRGRMSNEEITNDCRNNAVTHLIMLTETKGRPSSLTLCKYPNGPTYKFSLFNCKIQRRDKKFGEKTLLIIDGMDSEIGNKLRLDLSLCFPAIKDGNRVLGIINRNGTIAFRHFLIEKGKLIKECEFDMKLYKIINSTFDVNGDVDYVINAYTNTRKDDILKED